MNIKAITVKRGRVYKHVRSGRTVTVLADAYAYKHRSNGKWTSGSAYATVQFMYLNTGCKYTYSFDGFVSDFAEVEG